MLDGKGFYSHAEKSSGEFPNPPLDSTNPSHSITFPSLYMHANRHNMAYPPLVRCWWVGIFGIRETCFPHISG